MQPLATVEHEERERCVIVRVRGEIDVSNGDDIEAEILEGVTLSTERVILDLSDVAYFDSVGVRLAFDLQHRLTGQQISFAIVRDRGSYVRKVLDLCGAEQVLDVFDDIEAAQRQGAGSSG